MSAYNKVNGVYAQGNKGLLTDIKAEIAEAAIPNCHIVLYSGDQAAAGAAMLKTFNETLFAMNPAAVGGALPGDELYY